MSCGSPTAPPNGTARRRDRTAGGYRPGRIPGSRTRRPRPRARHLPDVVAVIDGRDAPAVEIEHRAHVLGHRRSRGACDGFGVALASLRPRGDRPALRQIAVDRIVRRGLIGDYVRLHAAAHEVREYLGRIAEQADGDRVAIPA